jgi:hypothetical protein
VSNSRFPRDNCADKAHDIVILAGLRVATKPATNHISFARRSAHRRAAFLHGESPMTKLLGIKDLKAAGVAPSYWSIG